MVYPTFSKEIFIFLKKNKIKERGNSNHSSNSSKNMFCHLYDKDAYLCHSYVFKCVR